MNKKEDCLIYLVIQIEGPKSSEEMLAILQRVIEECTPSLVAARLEAEERRNNQRLREEQDAAYKAALEADQVSCFSFFSLLIFFITLFVQITSILS